METPNHGQDWEDRMKEAPKDNDMTKALEKMERTEPLSAFERVNEEFCRAAADLSDALSDREDTDDEEK